MARKKEYSLLITLSGHSTSFKKNRTGRWFPQVPSTQTKIKYMKKLARTFLIMLGKDITAAFSHMGRRDPENLTA
jgi:hypothetical protein